jgi:hypothetical protein
MVLGGTSAHTGAHTMKSEKIRVDRGGWGIGGGMLRIKVGSACKLEENRQRQTDEVTNSYKT